MSGPFHSTVNAFRLQVGGLGAERTSDAAILPQYLLPTIDGDDLI
ncbi:MAG: hypothetical protein RJP95_04335 [Pirellulales bacterium]